MYDEQPDGDPHGECAAEIHRLHDRVVELESLLRSARLALNPIKALLAGEFDNPSLMAVGPLSTDLRTNLSQCLSLADPLCDDQPQGAPVKFNLVDDDLIEFNLGDDLTINCNGLNVRGVIDLIPSKGIYRLKSGSNCHLFMFANVVCRHLKSKP